MELHDIYHRLEETGTLPPKQRLSVFCQMRDVLKKEKAGLVVDVTHPDYDETKERLVTALIPIVDKSIEKTQKAIRRIRSHGGAL